ncbi:MAG TPA: AsmA-like C-terminal region-containing protein, partial [Isosphaeraceae bacterium]|nr:AsmA-like C-terminal region-containing protein [Isosphaeraceae bacterium]
MSFERIRTCLVRKWLLCLLVPPALWMLMVLLAPTEWARNRLSARLGRACGKEVRLGALRLGPLGGVRLTDLSIGEQGALADPWLTVREVRLDVHFFQMLFGACQPRRVEAEGVNLRIHRRADGKLEWGDLVGPRSRRDAPAEGPSTAAKPSNAVVEFLVHDARIHVMDEPSATMLEFEQVECQGSWEPSRTAIEALQGKLHGGDIQLAAQLVRSVGTLLYEGQVRCQGVPLERGMGALGYLIPVIAGTQPSVDGKFNLDLYVRAQGSTPAELRDSLEGRGVLALDHISVAGSRVIGELVASLNLPPRAAIGSLKSQFTIGMGRVSSDPLTLQLGQIPVVMAGWTDFTGHVDYRVSQDALSSRLPQEARKVLAELPIDLDQLVSIRLEGTLDDLAVTLDTTPERPGNPNTDGPSAERMRLREL